MNSYRVTAAGIYLLTTVCLIITALMTRKSGVSQGASHDGQQYLGIAAIAIHLGLPVFGITAGKFWRNGLKFVGAGAFVLVLLCAAFSVRNIMNFVAAERISIAKAHDAEAKTKAAREQAAIKAAEDRQKTINKMAQDQLAWVRGTVKDADGRKERKDSMDAGAKFITDFAKTDIAVAPTSVEPSKDVTVQSEAGAELLAELTGWRVSAIQLGDVIQIAIMLIIFETVGWPLASYLWGLTPLPAVSRGVLEPVHQPRPLMPTAREQRLLAAPRPKEKPPTIKVEPDAGWRALLDELDYPSAGSFHQGPPRAKDKREHVGPRFYVWMLAHGLTGDIQTENLDSLYDRYNKIDHRIPWGIRIVKSELEGLGKRFASKSQGNGTTYYSISAQTPEKVRILLEKRGILEPQGGSGGQGGTQDTEPEEPPLETAGGADSKVLALFGGLGGRRTGLH